MIIRVLIENHTERSDLTAEHGLSLYIEANGKRILFDAGQTEAFADNAKKLGVDLSLVDLCILSHGHYDHSGGLSHFLALNDHAPVYMHRLAAQPHYNASDKYIGIDASLAAHPRVVLTDDFLDLGDGISLCTCNALSEGCPSSARGMTVRCGDAFIQDDFSHEQYLTITEDGRRIVISGCSHKGILSIVKWLSPDVLIGGFHFMKLDLQGEDAVFVQHAASELLSHPCVYYTGHCTGDDVFAFLKARMGDRLHAIATGTEISISSQTI